MPKQPARKKPTAVEPELKIVRTAKCQSLTKKSTLTYNLSKDDNHKLYIRINSNSGGGFFSNEWILLDDITELIGDASDEKPITSYILFPLFKGKSVNTPSFLVAALLQEEVLSQCPGKSQHYVFFGTEKLLITIDK